MTGDGPFELQIRDSIRSSLNAFRDGHIPLRQLVDELNLTWNEIPESEWRDEFRGHWWTLEQVYAVALDRDELDSLSSDSTAAVDEAVAGLEQLLVSWPGNAG